MAENTEIAWCDSTFNPWIGCTKVGPGCDNCYAEADFDLRKHRAKWGPGNPRSRTSASNWRQPLRWNSKRFMACGACGWRGECAAELIGCGSCGSISHMNDARRRVFCASLADVFDNEVPDEWRADLFELIADTPHLDWLLLTKRIGNVRSMIEQAMSDLNENDPERLWIWGNDPWPNVWIGATVVNQAEADRDIPKLLAIPASVRWLSMEPLLGAVDLRDYLRPKFRASSDQDWQDLHGPLDWVVVGGESGANARPMHGSWAYDLHDQCEAAGVPFFFKQWGEWVNAGAQAFGTAAGEVRHIRSDGTFWNEKDDAIQDECADVLTVVRVGKKAAGRDLCGVQHDGYPEAKP